MLSFRLEREEMVKRRHSIDAAQGKFQCVCHIKKEIVLKISEDPLRSMEDLNECVPA
jgi:hypothetical protein